MKKILIIASAVLFAGCAGMGNGKKLDPSPNHEYRCGRGWPVCIQTDNLRMGDCMRLGDIWINEPIEQSVKKVQKYGGKFEKKNKDSKGRVYYIFGLPFDEKQKEVPYIILYNEDGRTSIIQLTGQATTANLNFSSICLGDTEETVADVMCAPRGVSEVEDIGGYMWNYHPFPVTVEFIQGKVYSIRITSHKGD